MINLGPPLGTVMADNNSANTSAIGGGRSDADNSKKIEIPVGQGIGPGSSRATSESWAMELYGKDKDGALEEDDEDVLEVDLGDAEKEIAKEVPGDGSVLLQQKMQHLQSLCGDVGHMGNCRTISDREDWGVHVRGRICNRG